MIFIVDLSVEIKLEGVGRDRNVDYLSSPELQEDGSTHKTGPLPSDWTAGSYISAHG